MLQVPGKILVADHMGNLDKFIINLLGQEHWYILHADNSYDFEKAILSERPDIVIINAHLPQLRLKEIINECYDKFSTDRPHTILAISREAERHVNLGIQSRVDEFLIVPFYGVELLAKINNFMRLRQEGQFRQNQIEALREQLVAHSDKISLAPPPVPVPAEAEPLSEPMVVHQRASIIEERPRTTAANKTTTRAARPVAVTRKEREPAAVIPMHGRTDARTPAPAPTPAHVPQFRSELDNDRIPSRPPMTHAEAVRRKMMTIMVLRVNHFEALINELDADESARIVKKLYQLISAEILRLGGQMSAVQGDMMTAVFTASTIFPNHRIAAVQAAMQLQLQSLFLAEKIAPITDRLSLSIALHTSMLTMTQLGQGMHGDTTIVGSILPLAMRLLELCPESSTIATFDCFGEILDFLCIAREFSLETNQPQPMRAAILSGINANAFVYHGDLLFKAT